MPATQNDETPVHEDSAKALREWVTPDFRSMDLLTAAGPSSGDTSDGGSPA